MKQIIGTICAILMILLVNGALMYGIFFDASLDEWQRGIIIATFILEIVGILLFGMLWGFGGIKIND